MQERFQPEGRRRGVILLVTLFIQATSVPLAAQDSAKAEADRYRRDARKAEAEYERLSRRLAPATFGSGGSECDEIVGRFCLRFDTGEPRPIPPEVPRVVQARRDAVEALRRAFAATPGDLRVAGSLVRYLVEDGRPAEAVSAAEAFAWATEDSTWRSLLVGFGLHARGDDVAALAQFEEGLARLPAAERRRFERVDVLLAAAEERLYRKLDEAAQERYERELWIMADPLYLTPGNEARAEHYARHVWARLLSEAPVVFGMVPWGRDLDELTLRYGVPAGRERVIASWTLDTQIIERFDPDQLGFVPERLRTEGVPETPAPGEPWPLENPRARSGFAPVTIRRLVPLAHQVTRFPAGDSVVLRVDGAFVLDSVAVDSAGADSRVSAALFVLDSAFTRVAERRRSVVPAGDTLYVSFEEVLPAGRFIYSLEALEEATRLAGRARYGVTLAGASAGALALSDPLLAWPYGRAALPRERRAPSLRPRASLELGPADTVGIYAEVSGLAADGDGATHYRIEVSMRRTDAAGIARAVRWLGRLLGLAGPDHAPRVSWEGAGGPGRTEALAVDLDLAGLKPGLYLIELAVQDLVVGTRREARKAIRVVEPD
jgi:hypothetical protein